MNSVAYSDSLQAWSQSKGSSFSAKARNLGNADSNSEMIQRIDANTEDVVDNVQGAQRELMKYWSRVSGNRWLVAKMFGVLMVSYVYLRCKNQADTCMQIFFLLWVLIAG